MATSLELWRKEREEERDRFLRLAGEGDWRLVDPDDADDATWLCPFDFLSRKASSHVVLRRRMGRARVELHQVGWVQKGSESTNDTKVTRALVVVEHPALRGEAEIRPRYVELWHPHYGAFARVAEFLFYLPFRLLYFLFHPLFLLFRPRWFRRRHLVGDAAFRRRFFVLADDRDGADAAVDADLRQALLDASWAERAGVHDGRFVTLTGLGTLSAILEEVEAVFAVLDARLPEAPNAATGPFRSPQRPEAPLDDPPSVDRAPRPADPSIPLDVIDSVRSLLDTHGTAHPPLGDVLSQLESLDEVEGQTTTVRHEVRHEVRREVRRSGDGVRVQVSYESRSSDGTPLALEPGGRCVILEGPSAGELAQVVRRGEGEQWLIELEDGTRDWLAPAQLGALPDR